MGVTKDPSKIRTDMLVTMIHTKSSELRRQIESCHAERALFKDDALKVQVLSKCQLFVIKQTNKRWNKQTKSFCKRHKNLQCHSQGQRMRQRFIISSNKKDKNTEDTGHIKPL